MLLFTYMEKYDAQVAELQGIRFCCQHVKPDHEKRVTELAEAYQAKYPQIVAFVQRGVSDLYGDIPAKVLEQSLGMPLIDLDWNTIMYLEHTLDKTHAIEVEFGGKFDQLYQVIIGK